MAWARNANNRFTPLQRSKIRKMRENGWEIADIAEKAGAAYSSIASLCAKTKPKPKPKPKPKKLPVSVIAPKSVSSDTLADYYQWALQGSLRNIGDTSFIDRLIEDVRDGKLG